MLQKQVNNIILQKEGFPEGSVNPDEDNQQPPNETNQQTANEDTKEFHDLLTRI